MDEVGRDLAAHIRRAQGAGSACPDLDPERTARWVVRILDRGLYDLVTPGSPEETDALLEALAEIVWRTLYAGYRAD